MSRRVSFGDERKRGRRSSLCPPDREWDGTPHLSMENMLNRLSFLKYELAEKYVRLNKKSKKEFDSLYWDIRDGHIRSMTESEFEGSLVPGIEKKIAELNSSFFRRRFAMEWAKSRLTLGERDYRFERKKTVSVENLRLKLWLMKRLVKSRIGRESGWLLVDGRYYDIDD